MEDTGFAQLLSALSFAADKHRGQRRKDREASPYINHPIALAEILARHGVTDVVTLMAAVLHDTIEDTETTPEELEQTFGSAVRAVVEEVTDDKTLPKDVRKRLQIEHAPTLSERAKLVKLADKISNVTDVTHNPPHGWDLDRRSAYLEWTAAVVDGCRGVSVELESQYDDVLRQARQALGTAR
jgi:(p)ppGpp synthase/HD superfamily hydrolase